MLFIRCVGFLQPFGATVLGDQFLHVPGRAMARNHQQKVFIVLVGDACHRARLGIAQLSFLKRFTDFWQLS